MSVMARIGSELRVGWNVLGECEDGSLDKGDDEQVVLCVVYIL